MELTEFKEIVAGHTQVTTRQRNGISYEREVSGITDSGIHSRLPWESRPQVFIDWPVRRGGLDYEIRGTTLTWLNNGRTQFSYTFPLTVEQALAAAYDEAGNPRTPTE